MDHEFDAGTDFCIRCGAGRDAAIDGQSACIERDANVVAISHLISGRRLERLTERAKP